ncbi:hypothetical protein KI387_005672, partial [Taxus chinensis]
PTEVGPHRYYTRSQARIQTDLNTGSGSKIMDRREDSHTPPRRERPDPDALFSVWDQESSREDIYADFSLHISTDQQGGDEECGKFEAYMRTLVSLMTMFEQHCIVHMKLLKKLRL